jgi:hypothetical protein
MPSPESTSVRASARIASGSLRSSASGSFSNAGSSSASSTNGARR